MADRILPPSADRVLQELRSTHPLTGKQLRERTGLPRRTLYTALQHLRRMGLLEARDSLTDTRQTYFWLNEG